MVAKSFEVGDLVWAKMKGFPPWPGKIIEPPADTKSSKIKKPQHYVFFYGSDNHAWIPDENIVLHHESLVSQYATKKRSSVYLSAIDTIVNVSKGSSKYHKPLESSYSKLTSDEESSPKSKSPHSNNSVTKKIEIKKKVPEKRITAVKKIKKRTYTMSVSHDGAESSGYSMSSKVPRFDDDYSNLMANIPPNIGYTHISRISEDQDSETVHPSTGLLSRNAYIERPATPPIDLESENRILKMKEVIATKKKIGFLGLGKMGQGIVKNLLQSGHCVNVWNRTTEKCKDFEKIGAKHIFTPADVIASSDITFCCVSDPDAAKGLVFGNCGVLKGLEGAPGENKGYVEMTSLDPKTSQAIGDEVTLRGGRYLECPLNGSRLQAIEGTLFILGCGDQSLFNECESVFRAIGRNALFMGQNIGTASKYNIVHSMLIGTVYAAIAESLALIERVGLEQGDFLDILQYGVLDSPVIIQKGHSMIKNQYTSNTPLKHMQKDLNLGLMLGSSVEQPMPITAAANEVYKHCKLLRYADHDVSAVYEGTRR